MEPDPSWTSASELADYAYCPRSYWYSRHPPPGGPSRDSQASSREGVRYHSRVLTAERHRAERGAAYWVVLLVGILFLVGGAWWVFRF